MKIVVAIEGPAVTMGDGRKGYSIEGQQLDGMGERLWRGGVAATPDGERNYNIVGGQQLCGGWERSCDLEEAASTWGMESKAVILWSALSCRDSGSILCLEVAVLASGDGGFPSWLPVTVERLVDVWRLKGPEWAHCLINSASAPLHCSSSGDVVYDYAYFNCRSFT